MRASALLTRAPMGAAGGVVALPLRPRNPPPLRATSLTSRSRRPDWSRAYRGREHLGYRSFGVGVEADWVGAGASFFAAKDCTGARSPRALSFVMGTALRSRPRPSQITYL